MAVLDEILLEKLTEKATLQELEDITASLNAAGKILLNINTLRQFEQTLDTLSRYGQFCLYTRNNGSAIVFDHRSPFSYDGHRRISGEAHLKFDDDSGSVLIPVGPERRPMFEKFKLRGFDYGDGVYIVVQLSSAEANKTEYWFVVPRNDFKPASSSTPDF